jgi:hypothetical protein
VHVETHFVEQPTLMGAGRFRVHPEDLGLVRGVWWKITLIGNLKDLPELQVLSLPVLAGSPRLRE